MKKGFTVGTFDLLHSGHIVMLEECKKHCDYLIVGLHVNPKVERPEKNKPVQSLIERQIQLKGCRYVDEVIVYEKEEDLLILLKTLDIDVRFLGADYKSRDKEITGKGVGPIHYCKRDHPWSSSSLRERVKKA